MKRTLSLAALLFALLSATGGGVVAQRGGAPAPALQVNPLWPEPLPNHWVLGSVTGVAVDAKDHIWVTHRGADSLEPGERGMMVNPPTSSQCCTAAPFVLHFDADGKLVSNFGGPGQGYQWPQSPGSLVVDTKGNVWITGAGLEPAPPGSARGRGGVDTTAAGVAAAARGAAAPTGPADAHVLKFSPEGKFLLQIGTPGKMEGPESQTTLNRPAAVAVDNAGNEVYVADSGNHRVVVFNSETGAYKRHWGAYGEKPTAAGGGAYDPAAPPARQFRDVTCVELAKDGMVYVCDRTSDRIQVFQKDGKFVKEGIISKNTRGATVTGPGFGVVSSHGSVWDIAFSSDPAQQHIFVADGHDKKVLIVQRDTLAEVGSLGDGGRQPGRFLAVGSIATDSRGNLYTGEQHHGKRVQKFVPGARR
jgi:DNA-binding beta-propeller fold protein YncE